METQGLSCPVSGKKVDETVVRLIAAQVVIGTLIAVWQNWYWLTALLLIDFGIRAFTSYPFSLLRLNAVKINRVLDFQGKVQDEAPKKFAAGIGFGMMLLLLIAQAAGWIMTAGALGFTLIGFASLEWLFSVCVGCYLFQWLKPRR